MSARPQIVAAGGALLGPESGNLALERYALDACGRERPRVCFVPTASGDDPNLIARFYETYARLGVATGLLRLFRRTPGDVRAFLADFDVVHVGGGNTRSMLATWRHWDLDAALRDAWARGTVMTGSSAGSLCWFESGVTDSIAGALTTMSCLGFVTGSHCPHYDGEAERKPFYELAIASGALAPGYACDDGAALHVIGDEIVATVASRPNANVYRVERDDGVARSHAFDMRRL